MSIIQSLRPDTQPKRRVLVVDDDLETVHGLATLIKAMGHEVQFAINGIAAIDIARKLRPEIILLDLELPDFKGDHIANQLKWEPGLEDVRIIAISGRFVEADRQRALAAGCADYRVKPLDLAVLEELLS